MAHSTGRAFFSGSGGRQRCGGWGWRAQGRHARAAQDRSAQGGGGELMRRAARCGSRWRCGSDDELGWWTVAAGCRGGVAAAAALGGELRCVELIPCTIMHCIV